MTSLLLRRSNLAWQDRGRSYRVLMDGVEAAQMRRLRSLFCTSPSIKESTFGCGPLFTDVNCKMTVETAGCVSGSFDFAL